MSTMDILVFINGIILGWILGQAYVAWKLRQALKKVAEENGMTLEELAESVQGIESSVTKVINVPNLFTEVSGNSIMLYNKDTGKFMGQAKSVEELAENLYKFDKVKFALVNHDERQFWFVEGKIKNDLKEIE
jgi:hypothetical protein